VQLANYKGLDSPVYYRRNDQHLPIRHIDFWNVFYRLCIFCITIVQLQLAPLSSTLPPKPSTGTFRSQRLLDCLLHSTVYLFVGGTQAWRCKRIHIWKPGSDYTAHHHGSVFSSLCGGGGGGVTQRVVMTRPKQGGRGVTRYG
jgi:hypothetical protein